MLNNVFNVTALLEGVIRHKRSAVYLEVVPKLNYPPLQVDNHEYKYDYIMNCGYYKVLR